MTLRFCRRIPPAPAISQINMPSESKFDLIKGNLKLGIIGYIPPPNIGYPEAFLQNMADYPAKYQMILFSDHTYPGILKIAASPEIAKTPTNKMAVNNLIFWTAIRIAAANKFTHIILIEPDCRVIAEGWDEIIYREFFEKNAEAITGGSVAIFNPCSHSGDGARRFEKYVIETAKDRKMPLSVTGSSNLAEFRDSCVFPNGAFAIYQMDWMLKTFPQAIGPTKEYYELAQTSKTWDYEIAIRLWNQFKVETYDKVVSIGCIYSGYGDVMSTEVQRRDMLRHKTVIGVHQIKSDWIPPKEGTEKVKTTTNTEIFIVTFHRDFRYLGYCLQSIAKFASGFSSVTILIPTQEMKDLRNVIAVNYNGKIPIRTIHGYEWKKKGFLWHEAMICRADEYCPEADFIAHFDPDCIFTAPVTPETLFQEGKPLLRYEPFETLCKRQSGVWNWKMAMDAALPFSSDNEYMRGMPHTFARATYEKTRQLIEQKHKITFNEYVRSCKNEYPQTFAEFNTLGAVAHVHFADSYCLFDLSKQENPDSNPFPVFQAWSHNPPDVETEVWFEGSKQKIKPTKIYKGLGIL